MTTEEKFEAAVNVIKSLPKNGSYQPSNDLMLRFYGYYKQATEGPCLASKPAFWDVVGRAKHAAWKKLGNMPKSEAMARYVEELHSIVETMSYSDQVASFLEAPPNELDSINMNDLELVAGDVMEKIRSRTNSPLGSRQTSPVHKNSRSGSKDSNSMLADDESDEEYIDTIEAPEPKKLNESLYFEPTVNGILQKEHISRSRTRVHNVDVSNEINKAIQSLQLDVENLRNKIQTLETDKTALARRNRSFTGQFSPSLVAFVIIWPFLCTVIINRFMKNK